MDFSFYKHMGESTFFPLIKCSYETWWTPVMCLNSETWFFRCRFVLGLNQIDCEKQWFTQCESSGLALFALGWLCNDKCWVTECHLMSRPPPQPGTPPSWRRGDKNSRKEAAPQQSQKRTSVQGKVPVLPFSWGPACEAMSRPDKQPLEWGFE